MGEKLGLLFRSCHHGGFHDFLAFCLGSLNHHKTLIKLKGVCSYVEVGVF